MNSVFPEDPKLPHPERSILTIYTGPEHYSFSLYDPEETGSYVYRKLIVKNRSDAFSGFKEFFFDRAFLSLPFRKVWIMNRTTNFTFVPDSIYKDEYKADFNHFLFSDNQGEIMTDFVSSAGIAILYQLPEAVSRFMLRSFSKPELIHYSKPLITYFLKSSENVNSRRMVINLQENGLDIFCFSRNAFLMGNYFLCKNISEALYYILFAWKQLQMNQLDDCLHILGNAGYREELIDRLALYLQQIRFPEISPEIYFSGIETDRIPFELKALAVCES